MSSEDLYLRLGKLVETMPDLFASGPFPAETQLWLGRAHALVKAANAGAGYDAIAFGGELGNQGHPMLRKNLAQNITTIVYRALAHAELAAPAPMQGAFLAIGTPFDAFAAMGKVLTRAQKSIRIVDPYLDENALTDFAVLAAEGVSVQILGSQGETKPAVKPAYERWKAQFGQRRPLEIRLSAPRSLHDRVIDIDGQEAWILTQSLNKLATRSPASISKTTGEDAELKIHFYADLWAKATPL